MDTLIQTKQKALPHQDGLFSFSLVGVFEKSLFLQFCRDAMIASPLGIKFDM